MSALISILPGTNNVVIDSPHSGQNLPPDFDFSSSLQSLQQAEDIAVDEIIKPLTITGAAIIYAEFPRSYIDVNRAVDDIDPALCGDKIKSKPTAYSYMGVGLIHRDARPGEKIYRHQLSASEIQSRIDNYYQPYYTALQGAIDAASYYGDVLHLNVHSMPSVTAPQDNKGRGYDLIIGTADGVSADEDVTMMIALQARQLGLSVAIDVQYKGGHIIRTFGKPAAGIQSVQLEFNRALYVNERTRELTDGVILITRLLGNIVSEWGAIQAPVALAAE